MVERFCEEERVGREPTYGRLVVALDGLDEATREQRLAIRATSPTHGMRRHALQQAICCTWSGPIFSMVRLDRDVSKTGVLKK